MGHAANPESHRVSRLEGLSPDLHATLSLLLAQRKSYAEIAGLLGIDEHAVHNRAHAALAMLAPSEARELTAAQRERVGEYLLGQDDPAARRETRAELERSASARAWAQALAGELAPLAAEPLPEIPAGTPGGPTSRVGGMVVLGAIAVVVIVAVALIVGLGGGGGGSHPSSSATTGSSTATTSSNAASSTTTASSEPRVDATLPLTAPDPASKALGVVEVVSRSNVLAFLVVAEHLPPTSGFRYAAWLYNSPTDALLLGSGPKVGSNGTLKAAGGLPSNASRYHKIILTEEHSEKPTQPGPIVLSGAFKVG
jgi:hypothetical protein